MVKPVVHFFLIVLHILCEPGGWCVFVRLGGLVVFHVSQEPRGWCVVVLRSCFFCPFLFSLVEHEVQEVQNLAGDMGESCFLLLLSFPFWSLMSCSSFSGFGVGSLRFGEESLSHWLWVGGRIPFFGFRVPWFGVCLVVLSPYSFHSFYAFLY